MATNYYCDSDNLDMLATVRCWLRYDYSQNFSNRLEMYCLRSFLEHICR